MIALLEAHRAGLLASKHWGSNALAGLVVGIVALPLAMAFAIASGARPEQGLYTAIVAGLVVSVCGGSRFQIAGPTGAFVAVLAGISAQYGFAGLQMATFMAGGMLLCMGVFRVGGVIRWVPHSVVAAFTLGIGWIVFVGQWPSFFGLQGVMGKATPLHEAMLLWVAQLASFPSRGAPTLGIAVLSLATVVLAPKLLKRVAVLRKVPGALWALGVGTAALTVLQTAGLAPQVATIGSTFGGIPQGLPRMAMLDFSAHPWQVLLLPALSIALLGAIESLLCCVVADTMAGVVSQGAHRPNQELIGQGLANLLVPWVGGFAATSALARTATNVRSGANSPLAGIVHALVLVGVLVLLAPWAAPIPLASLAAILWVVAWTMSDIPGCWALWRCSGLAERAVFTGTCVLTIFVDLVLAVAVGVALHWANVWWQQRFTPK